MAIIKDKQRLARLGSGEAAAGSHANVPGDFATTGFQLPDLETDEAAPPVYGDRQDSVQFSQPGFEAGAAITEDGRININILTKNRRLADLLAPTLRQQITAEQEEPPLPPAYIPPSLGGRPGQVPPPKLNLVIQIVGSRGDVQPFVALGKVLKDTYGHRVRIATHPTFQQFVEENDLEFFSIGGDPAELMAFMVKHPGLMPGLDAITSGEIRKRRKGIGEMLMGCWRSCIEAGNGLGPPPTPHRKDEPMDTTIQLPGDPTNEPFVADAIIANPPSFAHIHLAEKLGIPLHMMFTMPWSPTRAFPHPLANVQSSNTDDVMTNYLTYTLVEMMTWQGLGDVINRFREKALDLSPLSLIWAPGLLARLKISWTYCWSPALIPKPSDWGRHIDISGFYFLNLASSFTPDPELAAFLEAGPPPVYIGFGSIVVDDPDEMTRMIFDAIHLSGVRALVSKGWGGLGADSVGIPEGVFMLGNVPHDWLFERVSCVVHHGGAGTTAAGIKAGKPTIVVPFFGDQPFWGAMIARANAGPDPIPYKELTAEKLAEAIKYCLLPETLDRAKELGNQIREEKGTDVGGQSFHDHLDVDKIRCSLAPSRAAAWRVRRTQVRLSPLAAATLVNEGLIEYTDLKLYRSAEYNTEDQPPDPISAAACSLVMDLGGMGMAIADMPREIFRGRSGMKDHIPKSQSGSPRNTFSMSSPPSGAPSTIGTIPSSPPEQPNDSRSSVVNPLTPERSQTDSASIVSTSTTPASSIKQQPTPAPSQVPSIATRAESNIQQDLAEVGGFGIDAAVGTGRSVGRIVTTGVRTPMNFCLGLAKGFRNVPRLYNDDTIRPVEKVTDFNTGLKVASKEFGYGLFDGISGLVTQPLKGAEKEGAGGLVKGFGKGIGGLITKPVAGFWGIPAYTMQGVHAEINKYFTKSVQNYIFTSRAVQGERDLHNACFEERQDIIKRWSNAKYDLKDFYQLKRKEKVADKQAADPSAATAVEPGLEPPKTGWLHTRKMTFDERKKLHAQRQAWKTGYVDTPVPPSSSGSSSIQSNSSEDAEFEKAIQASVQETSHGNAEEDAMIEAAIRRSIKAVREQVRSNNVVPDMSKNLREKDPSIFEDSEYHITDEEYQALIEQAIQQSMRESMPLSYDEEAIEMEDSSSRAMNSSENLGNHDDDDVELKRALEASRNPPDLPPRDNEDDELQRALAASREAMEKEKSQRTEEDIVLEYIKKQSLAEEEYRKKVAKDMENDATGTQHDEHDEELKRAMEESLKMSRGDDSGPSRS